MTLEPDSGLVRLYCFISLSRWTIAFFCVIAAYSRRFHDECLVLSYSAGSLRL